MTMPGPASPEATKAADLAVSGEPPTYILYPTRSKQKPRGQVFARDPAPFETKSKPNATAERSPQSQENKYLD